MLANSYFFQFHTFMFEIKHRIHFIRINKAIRLVLLLCIKKDIVKRKYTSRQFIKISFYELSDLKTIVA